LLFVLLNKQLWKCHLINHNTCL